MTIWSFGSLNDKLPTKKKNINVIIQASLVRLSPSTKLRMLHEPGFCWPPCYKLRNTKPATGGAPENTPNKNFSNQTLGTCWWGFHGLENTDQKWYFVTLCYLGTLSKCCHVVIQRRIYISFLKARYCLLFRNFYNDVNVVLLHIVISAWSTSPHRTCSPITRPPWCIFQDVGIKKLSKGREENTFRTLLIVSCKSRYFAIFPTIQLLPWPPCHPSIFSQRHFFTTPISW